jgi:hypothetical protein
VQQKSAAIPAIRKFPHTQVMHFFGKDPLHIRPWKVYTIMCRTMLINFNQDIPYSLITQMTNHTIPLRRIVNMIAARIPPQSRFDCNESPLSYQAQPVNTTLMHPFEIRQDFRGTMPAPE